MVGRGLADPAAGAGLGDQRVGSGVARARGPFGRRITDHDAQTLELVAQLLESAAETAEKTFER
jgi:hypothetical protein